MDNLLLVLNIAACVLLASLCTWAVLSPRVRDGVLVKLGLILAVQGFAGLGVALAGGYPLLVIVRALGLLHVGLLVVVCGWWWRRVKAGNSQRRVSDWMDLSDLQHEGGRRA